MKEGAINFAPSFNLILQIKNPTNVGLDNYFLLITKCSGSNHSLDMLSSFHQNIHHLAYLPSSNSDNQNNNSQVE